MATADVYFRGDVIYVASTSKDVFGIGHVGDLYLRYERSVAPRALGDAVVAAFAAYREGIPGTTYVRGEKRPLHAFLRFAGFRSWRALEKGAQLFIMVDGVDHVEILPTVARAEGGFLHQPERTRRCSRDADDIGRTLIEAAYARSG